MLFGGGCCGDFSIAFTISASSVTNSCSLQHSRKLYLYTQYGNTHAAFTYFVRSNVQHTVAVVDGQQIIFFANRQNFSLKMFAGSVALNANFYTSLVCNGEGVIMGGGVLIANLSGVCSYNHGD